MRIMMTTAAGQAQGLGRRWVLARPSTGALFVLVVALHWVEHLVQAVQIHAVGIAPAKALGAVGAFFPGLVRSEWLHLAFDVGLLVGLVVLRRLFTSRGRRVWHLAIAGQSWPLFEHLLLFAQAQTGARFFGTDAPSSVLQLLVPRADLHLAYNGGSRC